MDFCKAGKGTLNSNKLKEIEQNWKKLTNNNFWQLKDKTKDNWTSAE